MRQACLRAVRTHWTLQQHLDRTEALYAAVHAEVNGTVEAKTQTTGVAA
jgi:hypothetical protein